MINKNTYYIEKIVPLLMMGGIMIHLINLGRYIHFGKAELSFILLPVVDFPLGLLMLYCAIILIFRYKQLFAIFDMSAIWRKVVYWLIAFYIAMSIPGHVFFLSSGDTTYFDFWPWWFSPIIMVVYILFIIFFFTLEKTEEH